MKFRPCIDIHDGKVKQIVGGTLKDEDGDIKENYVSKLDGAFYGKLYQKYNLRGGHVILLNSSKSECYKKDVDQAALALKSFPGGLQIGGGITADNAVQFLNLGATHVIVTSYVFQYGRIQYQNLNRLLNRVGKEHLVLDLSCRKQGEQYYIVTDRWQKFTNERITMPLIEKLSSYCNEFLIHAVDVEGKNNGIEQDLVQLLGEVDNFPITYAGGVSSMDDLNLLRRLGNNHLDVTIGSSLDLFGGCMNFHDVIEVCD